MHDPEETMGPRDATTGEAMEDTGAIPSDTQPAADDAAPGLVRPNQASDQSNAPIPDVMGEPAQPAPDVMGAQVPETDETLGDRNEVDRL